VHHACHAVTLTVYGGVCCSVFSCRFTGKPQLHAPCQQSAGAFPWFAVSAQPYLCWVPIASLSRWCCLR
jgi:hypothetical protein